MTVRLGINPIGWTNDCMRWLGDEIPLEACLAEARAAGFSGIEIGRKFPRTVKGLSPLLERHGLCLVSGWYSARLVERDARAEIGAMRRHLDLMVGCGATVMVFAETTGEIVNTVGAPASARPRLAGAAAWRRLGRRFTEVARHMLGRGVRMAVHHHMGTVVQTADDIDRLMDCTGPEVGLLLDTGHLTMAGGDPIALAKQFAERIVHVHCKDIRRFALETCKRRDASFSEAVLHGVFTAPGDGIVDFAGVFRVLARSGYQGWLVQEAEQEPRMADPRIYAELGNAHLRRLCRGVRLAVA
ncbi:MAG: myo-inosose-2 dehydratase [Alphaproteobacteria bacterium]